MSKEEIVAEIEKLETQQKQLEGDWHALRGAIAAYRNILAQIQPVSNDKPSEPEPA